jgi:hypothetical protein
MGRQKLIKISLATLFALGAQACGGGSTSGGEKDPLDGQFGSGDSTTGRVDLKVANTELQVGETSEFKFLVYDAKGRPVPQIRVICDTESGLTILEPSRGVSLTTNGGAMSGIVGCSQPGSFQIGCRLPAGGNKRKFAGIKCGGSSDGFGGFPGGAGGGLGGGGVPPVEGGDVARITAINGLNSSGTTTTSIDTTLTSCGAGSTETFGDDRIGVAVLNSSTSAVRIVRARIIIENGSREGADLESPLLGVVSEIAPGATGSVILPFLQATGASKSIDGSTPVGNGSKTVSVTLFGRTLDAEEFELEASSSFSFAETRNCGSASETPAN